MSTEIKLSATNLSQKKSQNITGEIVTTRRSDDRDRSVARSSEYVYVNAAYVGSVNNLGESRLERPTSVIREQYWACSRWPFAQRFLALAVGVLLGAVIGLAVTIALKNNVGDTNIIGGLLRKSAPD